MNGGGGLTIESILALGPVVPVLTIARAEDAVPLARALADGGLGALEITLRTPQAVDAIRAVAQVQGAEVEGVVAGAGTVTDAAAAHLAIAAGAGFIVSPGLSDSVAAVCADAGVPYLPGVATASEIMRALDLDLPTLKFFPAEPAGGIAALKALGGPFPSVRFCPTGGLGADNFRDYLALENVAAVGGSWLAPADLIAARAWADITRLAAAALARA